MVTIKRIKLNQFSKVELDQRKQNMLKGGSSCACIGCYCAGTNSGVYTADGPQLSNRVHSSDGGSYEQ